MWEGRGLESHLGQLFFYLWKGGDLGVVPVDFLVIVWKLPFKCIRRERIANVQLKPEKRSIKSSWALALPIIHKAYLFSQVPTPFILSTHSPRAPPLIEYNYVCPYTCTYYTGSVGACAVDGDWQRSICTGGGADWTPLHGDDSCKVFTQNRLSSIV